MARIHLMYPNYLSIDAIPSVIFYNLANRMGKVKFPMKF